MSLSDVEEALKELNSATHTVYAGIPLIYPLALYNPAPLLNMPQTFSGGRSSCTGHPALQKMEKSRKESSSIFALGLSRKHSI
jgi:hypothetical protein